MQGNCTKLRGLDGVGWGWIGLDGVGPGGMREGTEASRLGSSGRDCLFLLMAEPAGGAGRIEPAERYTASPHIGISAADLDGI